MVDVLETEFVLFADVKPPAGAFARRVHVDLLVAIVGSLVTEYRN